MRLFTLLLSLILCLTISAKNEFKITGKMLDNTFNGKTAYLHKVEDPGEKPVILDSCVIKNSGLEFKGEINDYPKLGIVEIAGSNFAASVILEPGNIELIQTATSNSLKGTKANEEFQSFMDEQENLRGQLQAMQERDSSDPELVKVIEGIKKSAYNYIEKNKTNSIGELFLLSTTNFFEKEELKKLLDGMRPEFLSSKKGSLIKSYAMAKEVMIGDNFIDMSFNNPEGKEIALSDYVGKNEIVLIDFWASWCGPCRKEMPTVVEAYKKYKDKGFEIVGISLDDNRDSWAQSIKSMNMSWPQMSDLGGWKSAAAVTYNVTSIPLTLLVDKDGKVIAKNLRGQALLSKLDELLK